VIIKDLEYLEFAVNTEGITGSFGLSPSVYTGAIALASPGFAYANALALAFGEITTTSTQNYAKTFVDGGLSISLAYASASAYASTGGHSSFSRNDYFAFSISTNQFTANIAANALTTT
jgi:hypothetical protein